MANTKLSYVDFEPQTEWKEEQDAYTMIFTLPGFQKGQLKVQLRDDGILRVSGERPANVEGSVKRRFVKETKLPQGCDINAIGAKFSFGELRIVMPKKAVTAAPPVPTAVQKQEPPVPTADQKQLQEQQAPLAGTADQQQQQQQQQKAPQLATTADLKKQQQQEQEHQQAPRALPSAAPAMPGVTQIPRTVRDLKQKIDQGIKDNANKGKSIGHLDQLRGELRLERTSTSLQQNKLFIGISIIVVVMAVLGGYLGYIFGSSHSS